MTRGDDGGLFLLVQGSRSGEHLFRTVFQHGSLLDLTRVESNDIHAMATKFGIEAARKTLTHEVAKVFGAYGIAIDPRHLSLVTDFMTTTGTFKGCNRSTLAHFGNPLLQMSYETALQFLRKAVLYNTVDDMHAPSSTIALGHLLTGCGTGSVDILTDLAAMTA